MNRLSAALTVCVVVISGFGIMHASTFDFVSYSIDQQLAIIRAESIEGLTETSHPQSISTGESDIAISQSIQADFNLEIMLPELILLNMLQTQDEILTAEVDEEAVSQQEFFKIGQHVKLLPNQTGPVIQFPGTFQFMAQLENPYRNKTWRVQVEATVTHEDGSTRTAVKPRAILLFPGQTLELPIKVRAHKPKYQPGLTLFTALIKDMSGQIIDQATITFNLENHLE